MYLPAIKIFCDVVRDNSFSKAARRNDVSQSAVSQNILQLEKNLGVKLIDRSVRPFALTPEGQLYYTRCKDLVERYYAAESEVKSLKQEIAGVVRVAAIYSIGLRRMSELVQRFTSYYPKASVQLSYVHPDKVYESVLSDEADLGLVSYPRSRRDLVVLPWKSEKMVIVVSPKDPLALKKEVELGALAGRKMVGFDEGLMIRREIDERLREEGVWPDIRIAFDNIEAIKRAVEIGEGFAILPEPAIKTEVGLRLLVGVQIAGRRLERPIGIIHRKSHPVSRATERFLGLLKKD